MMPASLVTRLAQLLAYAHRGSLDVPAGLIDRACVFRLNGTAYDEALGRGGSDPLTRLVGRGPAAYRFLLQGLRYAVPDAVVTLDNVQGPESAGLVTGVATLTGTPRSQSRQLVASIDVALVTNAEGRLVEVGVRVPEAVVPLLSSGRGA